MVYAHLPRRQGRYCHFPHPGQDITSSQNALRVVYNLLSVAMDERVDTVRSILFDPT